MSPLNPVLRHDQITIRIVFTNMVFAEKQKKKKCNIKNN